MVAVDSPVVAWPCVGPQQTSHILYRNGIGAHILYTLALIYPGIQRVYGAQCIGDRTLGMAFHRLYGFQRHLDVAHVVHRIKHTEHIDTIHRSSLHKALDDIIRVVPVTEDILAAQQHLLTRVGHGFLELANALPGVLAEVTDAGVESGAAPGFDRPVTHRIQLCGHRQHVLKTDPGCQQRLVAVAQNHVGDAQWALVFSHAVSISSRKVQPLRRR